MTAVSERVARGAALLDAKVPGWADRIDPGALDITDCARCILGQLYGHGDGNPGDCVGGDGCPFDHGLIELGLSPFDHEDDEHGFDGPAYLHPDLTAEWKRVITARQAATAGTS